MNWRYLSYSVAVGVSITALSRIMFKQGGEFVLWPGIFIQVLANGLTVIVMPKDSDFLLPSSTYLVLNTAFYSLIVFILLLLIVRSKRFEH